MWSCPLRWARSPHESILRRDRSRHRQAPRNRRSEPSGRGRSAAMLRPLSEWPKQSPRLPAADDQAGPLSSNARSGATRGIDRAKRGVGRDRSGALIIVPRSLALGRGLHAINTEIVNDATVFLDVDLPAEFIDGQLAHFRIHDSGVVGLRIAGGLDIVQHARIDAGLLTGRHASMGFEKALGEGASRMGVVPVEA